jgi:hypothetical protein
MEPQFSLGNLSAKPGLDWYLKKILQTKNDLLVRYNVIVNFS